MKGSEKQIAWAEDIKRNAFAIYSTEEAREELRDEKPDLYELLIRLESIEDASWFIEYRAWLAAYGLRKINNMIERGRIILP